MTPFSLRDIRGAARGLRRAPTVTISAIFCLGLGLGVTTAVFSAIDRALLTPLPFRDPGALVTVYRTTPQFNTGPFSAPNYVDLARSTHRLTGIAALTPTTALLARPDGATQVSVLRVTGNLFSLLGVHAARGRLLAPSDDAAGETLVVVLSDELWREQFGADPTLVGRTIRLDGASVTVAGVLPPRFRVLHGWQMLRADIWVPMRFTTDELGSRGSNFLMALGRLAPGASVASAQAELRSLYDGLVTTYPEMRGDSVRVVPLQADGVRAVRTPLLLLFGAVCMVLLIAATNVGSLLLARGVQRRREMAVRAALGATRWAVMRPVLAESLLLTGLGVAVGLALAWAGVRTIGALAAERLPQLTGLSIDVRVVLFALVLSVLVALLCGALPAWRSAAADPQEALRGSRGGGAGLASHRALRALVIAEVALSLVLLVGAGLVLEGFATLVQSDPGFDPKPLLTLEATVSPERYQDGTTVRRFLEPALAAIREAPGVESAGSISLLPYVNWGWNFNIRYEGQPGDDPTKLPLVERRVVTPEFFQVTRQRLLAGRLLRAADDDRPDATPVVVVNEALVRRDFRGRDPIGTRFYIGDTTFATIVGVVSDIRNVGPVNPPSPEVYWSYRQGGNGSTTFPIVVRAKRGDPAQLAQAVRMAIHAVDPGAAVTHVRPMTEVIARSVGTPRFYLTLLGTFAVVAVVLAVSGLYGVMSYTVAQRTRELGIRAALGSSEGRTLRHVAGQGMLLVAAGVIVGLAGGAGVTRLLRGMLYGVSPLDAKVWLLTTLALASAGLLATLVPALRATRVDPLIAMREE
jgi:predicted permease